MSRKVTAAVGLEADAGRRHVQSTTVPWQQVESRVDEQAHRTEEARARVPAGVGAVVVHSHGEDVGLV